MIRAEHHPSAVPRCDVTKTTVMSRIPDAGVYAIENTANGRIYIGSSTQLQRRIDKHHADIRRGHHESTALREELQRFGPEAFQITVLQRVSDLTELEYLEHVWMRRLGGLGIQGYNTNPARRLADKTPDEAALLMFEETFTRRTSGITDAEAASVLNRESVVTPHGGRTWTGKAVKQARGFIVARQRRRAAEEAFRRNGELQRLRSRVTELREHGTSWKATLATLTTEGFTVPGTDKPWSQHLLMPWLKDDAI